MDFQRLSQNPQFLAVWFGLSYAYRVISLTFLTFLDNGGLGLMDPHTLLVSPLKKKLKKRKKKNVLEFNLVTTFANLSHGEN